MYFGVSIKRSNNRSLQLDFGVHYRVLKNDPLKALFSHTLVPMLTLEYSKELCVKPTGKKIPMVVFKTSMAMNILC